MVQLQQILNYGLLDALIRIPRKRASGPVIASILANVEQSGGLIRVAKLLRYIGTEKDLGHFPHEVSFEQVRKMVGGDACPIVLSTGERAFVNEDAGYSDLPLNPLAFLHHIYTGGRRIHVRGNVVTITDKEWSDFK